MRKTFTSGKQRLFQASFLLIFLMSLPHISSAQIPAADIIDAATTSARKEAFHTRFQGSGRQTTRAFTFSVAELQTILDEYKAAGVSKIVMVPALIRNEDADRYVVRAGLNTADRGKIINRQTLLIKKPQPGGASLTNFYVTDVYYDRAVICPPPLGSCIE